MPLFKATVLVSCVVEIPIYAKSKSGARRYLRATDEWHDDASFDERLRDKINEIKVRAVEQIESPELTPHEWTNDDLCWNSDDMKIGAAFFSEQLRALEPNWQEIPDSQYDEAVERLLEAEDGMLLKFAEERCR